jgi:hypothetical protein
LLLKVLSRLRKEGSIMAEEIQTGHRVFGGTHRIGLEIAADKPFVIEQPGGRKKTASTPPAPPSAPSVPSTPAAPAEVDQTAADIAARIAGDRQQKQADILELARTKPGSADQ